ncbi:flagellar hook-associated protein FlgK [Lysobacter sp. 2RAF19]
MTGILSTGTSALLAFQRALGTVGHNVANAATPGYSRQRVELSARPGQATNIGAIGQGVDVARLRRLADGLVFARQVDSSGEMGRLEQLSSLNSRVDALLSDKATGLSTPWSAFFAAAKGVSSDPTSPVARSQLITAGDQLAARWRSLDGQLSSIEEDTDQRLKTTVGDANRLAGEIAGLNRDIATAGTNASPDLLDAREQRIGELAKLVGGSTVAQDDGSINVFTAGGQPLVLGARSMQLTTVTDPYRSDRLQVALEGSGGTVRLSASAFSGEVGGLLEFRAHSLDPARADLGRVATAFAMAANDVQRAGVDYNGVAGTDLFAVAPPRVDAHAKNTGSATLSATIVDTGALTGHDLELRFDGTTWSATRAGTGEAVALAGTGTAADPLRAEGVSIVVGGAAAAGDRFAVAPTADAAGSLKLIMRDPNGIAAASPLQVKADAANIGNAKADAPVVTDPAAFASFAGATVDFIDATTYTIDGAGPYTFTAGTPIAGNSWSLNLQGTPGAGDSFTLARTPPRAADNGNARNFAALDTKGVLDGGATSLTNGLSQLTARVGSDARHADLALDAQQTLDTQIAAERDSVSGVNLDEEAADMLRYQQAYQAAAQVIATADNVFQTLLGAIR